MAPQADWNPINVYCDENDSQVRVTKMVIEMLPRNLTAVLVLSQIAYMFSTPTARTGTRFMSDVARTKISIDGGAWVFADRHDLSRRLGLSLTQVSRAVRTLCAAGLLIKPEVEIKSGDDHLVRLGDSVWDAVAHSNYGVTLYTVVLNACEGRIPAAIVLTDLCYWFGKSEKDGKCRASRYDPEDQRPWVSKSLQQFADEIGLSKRQIQHSINWLLANGWIMRREGTVTGCCKSPAAEYSIYQEAFTERLGQAERLYWYDSQA